jgi:hypothetical protein
LVTEIYSEFDVELYNLFYTYSFQALKHPSPITRTNALKIINEISLHEYEPILAKIDCIYKLINDNWWEVCAQILIICSNLLLFLAQENEAQNY